MGTREHITEAAKALGLESRLSLVAPNRYQGILERIIAARTLLHKSATSALWWWEALREPVAFTQPADSVEALKRLVTPNESVWFVVEAGGPKKSGNFWLYESTIEVICAVLREIPACEYYVVSRKLDWLLCENHHDVLIASGAEMVARMEALTQGV